MIHLTHQESKVLFFLGLLFALGATLSFLRSSSRCRVCLFELRSSKADIQVLDVNKATREELISLPGIGEKTADAILAYRGSVGKINSLDELVKVKGLTDSKIEQLKNYLVVK